MSRSRDRLWSALNQVARRQEISSEAISRVAAMTRALVALCGEQSRSRQMQFRIGTALMLGNVHILAPACPDYTHESGRYTFRGVSGGVSLLANLQIRFLQSIARVIPSCRITLLIADHEADDEALCSAIGKSQKEFQSLIQESVRAVRDVVRSFGWRAEAMTTVIPDLVAEEQKEINRISNDQQLTLRIATDTIQRSEMYRKIGSFTAKEMTERTIRTAAQYRVMGRFVARNKFLVANHSTVNLSWYREAAVAVLHNPVAVY